MRFAVAGMFYLMALPPIVCAQQRQPLSQAQAMLEAEQHAPDVRVGRAQVAVADSEVDVAGMLPNPTIGGGVSPAFVAVATVSMTLPIFGQTSTAADAARAQTKVAEASVEVLRLDSRLAAALTWTDLWMVEREMALAEEEVARYDRTLAAAEARVADGSAPALDRIRADADARRAHSTLAALSATHEAVSARLAVLVGKTPGEVTFAAQGDPDASQPPALAQLGTIVDGHPLAKRAGTATHAAEAVVTREKRARWTQLGLSVQDWVSRSTRLHDVRVLGTVDIPLFDAPRVDRAQAMRKAAEVDAEAVHDRLYSTAVAARAEYMAAQERCDALSASVVPAMREAATRSEEAYTEGSLDLASTQTAEKARSDAELALLTCLANRARARAQLEHALGGARAL